MRTSSLFLLLILWLNPVSTHARLKVGEDGMVDLEMKAPNAEAVVFHSWDIREGSERSPVKPLRKEEDGIWRLRFGPIDPGIYQFTMKVDGETRLLPGTKTVGRWAGGGIWNLLHIRNPNGPTFEEEQDVQRGNIVQHWMHSNSLKQRRRFHIYLPPGYLEHPEKTYPVLYLLHGAGDDDSGWTEKGHAHIIVDNLIADKKIPPLIVVMPNGRIPGKRDWRNPQSVYDHMKKDWTPSLHDEVIPEVEKHFRAAKEPAKKALAGLSMGGFQTAFYLTQYPNAMDHIGIFSKGGLGEETETLYADFFQKADALNQTLSLFFVACGEFDFIRHESDLYQALLTKYGIDHQWVLTENDDHTWTVWRRYLRDFLVEAQIGKDQKD